ncbi:helix-turn-helix domain-containing protein [Undibacterium sp. Di24W]|uniref:helix-turn-helix domain-containing protein n=1 Tax=Undibacterium sp. Di24W TaxID=3413033 RepID=UPI003BF42EE7
MHLIAVELSESAPRASYFPASLCPSLMLFLRGSAQVEQPDGSFLTLPRVVLNGPFIRPTHWISSPDAYSISVQFRPGMLHQAIGVYPETLLSSSVSLYDVVDSARIDALLAAIDAQRDQPGAAAGTVSEYTAMLQNFLLDILDHKKKQGMGAAFLAAHQQMFMPLIDLSLHFGVGERQLERRVRESFGVNLRDTRRIVRFGWSLLRIIGSPVTWGDLTQIAHDSDYYDQAHMHKEYLEFTGFSPTSLLQKIASNDPAFWIYRLSQSDTKKLFLPV